MIDLLFLLLILYWAGALITYFVLIRRYMKQNGIESMRDTTPGHMEVGNTLFFRCFTGWVFYVWNKLRNYK